MEYQHHCHLNTHTHTHSVHLISRQTWIKMNPSCKRAFGTVQSLNCKKKNYKRNKTNEIKMRIKWLIYNYLKWLLLCLSIWTENGKWVRPNKFNYKVLNPVFSEIKRKTILFKILNFFITLIRDYTLTAQNSF